MPAARIITPSGNLFDILAPDPDDFRIEDIAHSLAMECRFKGSTRAFYSVAQHSVYISFMVSGKNAFAGLLHDATEAYLRDIQRPLKVVLPEYERLEKSLAARLAFSFELHPLAFEDEEIKAADDRLQTLEAKALIRNPEAVYEWAGGRPDGTIYDVDATFQPWMPHDAAKMFLQRFYALRVER